MQPPVKENDLQSEQMPNSESDTPDTPDDEEINSSESLEGIPEQSQKQPQDLIEREQLANEQKLSEDADAEKSKTDTSPDGEDSKEVETGASLDEGVRRGLLDLSFEHEGLTRSALLYVPESYNPVDEPPLMINFHGFGLSSESQMKQADMRSLAERDGFLLAYPQGTLLGRFPHWNALPPSPENKSEVDDLGFTRELVRQIESEYPLNRERIYASGFSNGGMMAYALACYGQDLVAAIGVVSGQLLDNSETCAPESALGVIILHGTNDRVLPYDGAFGQLSVQGAIDFWTNHNDTITSTESESFTDGEVDIERFVYDQGTNGVVVEHHRYLEGEHNWFSHGFEESDASGLIWNFVSRYDTEGAL
jgi:polyhydroxybutyrate depolymerase